MSASTTTDDTLALNPSLHDHFVEEAEIVPLLRAEMERVDLHIIDMTDRILPLWSSPHDLFPDVAAVLQRWYAAQADMRAFFASSAYIEVQALRKKYAKLERMAETVCQLMDLQRWINAIQFIICIRTDTQMVCTHKQLTVQQLVSVVRCRAGDCGQSCVVRLLSKTRARLAVQQSCARPRLDHLVATDEDRAEIASLDWTSEAHRQVYDVKWSQMRSNHYALLALADICKAVSWHNILQTRCRDARCRERSKGWLTRVHRVLTPL